jgi:hypothetical protein
MAGATVWTAPALERLVQLRESGLTWKSVAARLSGELGRQVSWEAASAAARFHGSNVKPTRGRASIPEPAATIRPPRFGRSHVSLTAMICGDPAPGRTPWAAA